jgi:hypothetical protein
MYQVNRLQHLIKQGAQQNNYWSTYANALTNQQNTSFFFKQKYQQVLNVLLTG